MTKNPASSDAASVLKGATATAALLGAVRAAFPAGAFAQAAGPETNKATLGFIALTDCLAADHRQGEEALRQVRHPRRRGRQAGLLGHARATTSCWARAAAASTARTS